MSVELQQLLARAQQELLASREDLLNARHALRGYQILAQSIQRDNERIAHGMRTIAKELVKPEAPSPAFLTGYAATLRGFADELADDPS